MPATGKRHNHSPLGSKAAEPFATSGRPSDTRAARSFKARRGRFTATQRAAYQELTPALLVPPSVGALDHQTVFGRVAPLVLDIGFGMGDSTIALAQQLPHSNILGIDVHVPGLANVALRAIGEGLANVRLVAADAIDVLTHMVPEGGAHLVQIAFPDPWPKVSQSHRRLVDGAFAELLARCLEHGGEVRVATDSRNYADQMLRVLTSVTCLCNLSNEGFTPRDCARPITKYEQRALAAGRAVFELRFVRVQRDGSKTAGST